MRKKGITDFHDTDELSQEDGSSIQLSLPESIDDSLNMDGFPIIPRKGSTVEAQLYFVQLQESLHKIEKLEQEKSDCLDAIQNGRTPTDEEFESIRRKALHDLSFQELYWKIVYDAVWRHKQQLETHKQNYYQHCECQSPPNLRTHSGTHSAVNQGSELQPAAFDAQGKIQELQSTLIDLKEKYLQYEKTGYAKDEEEELKKLRRLNEELQLDCEKHQRSLIECKINSVELERKIEVIEKDNASLLKEKEQYIVKLDQSEEECRKKGYELHDTMTKLEHLSMHSTIKLNACHFEQGKINTKSGNNDETTSLAWSEEKEALLRHSLETKISKLHSELQERNIDYAKLEILHEERGKQLKDSHRQIDMLHEQLHVLKREFENLEKESLMERKRLNDEILTRDEQLDMYLDSKMNYNAPQLESFQFQSPSKTINNQCDNCRHLLAHTVVLAKKCKEFQIKINELETKTIQQQATAETTATVMRYKTAIQSLEERVSDLQKKNDAMRIENECSYPFNKRSIRNRNSSKSHPIHHIFILPQKKDHKKSDSDEKSIHLEYRGPGSSRIQT